VQNKDEGKRTKEKGGKGSCSGGHGRAKKIGAVGEKERRENGLKKKLGSNEK